MTTNEGGWAHQEKTRLAAAYLSRVAEPASLALWHFVRTHGYLAAAEAVRAGDVPDAVRSATESRRRSAAPELDLEAADAIGVRLVTPADEAWPHFAVAALDRTAQRLLQERRSRADQAGDGRGERCGPAERKGSRDRPDPVPPLALWVRGEADLAVLGTRSIAIVGARAATAYGQHIAAELAFGVAERGVTVVSGGAFGIDAAAHRGALAARGTTVLVSAAGLDRPYPAANAGLFDAVAESGMLVSERPPGSAPHRQRFLSRNRLIAAFGSATVLVEAARRSGALNTAGYCRDLGRPLLAVPGPVTSAMSAGCHSEIRRDEGAARLVTSVPEVMEWVGGGHVSPSSGGASVESTRDGLSLVERAVLDGFPSRRPVTESDLARASGQPIQHVMAALPELISAGFVSVSRAGYQLTSGASAGRRPTAAGAVAGAPAATSGGAVAGTGDAAKGDAAKGGAGVAS